MSMDYTVDSSGDKIYKQPKDWSLDKDPKKMNQLELSAAVARDLLGCKPKWWGYYADWTCGCKGDHTMDQQCSIIAAYAEDARYARQVAVELEKKTGFILPATFTPRQICERALIVIRGIDTSRNNSS